MSLKLLALGDLHLGRLPSRLPDELQDRAREMGPVGAWRRIVDAAIDERVDAIALAGDVVEDEYDFFEAYRELAAGVERLLDANIRVLGVVGNHDVQVLPRLAEQIEGFELLGRGGEWEQITLVAGSERMTVHGWSFPQRVVRLSPLAEQWFDPGPGPNLGLLHCDCDQTGSAYAPVTTAELQSASLDGWLLGHIHAPDLLSVEHPIGYLGSATGLDSGEPGPRGPWLVTVDGGRIVGIEHWPLAPLHWQRLPVDLTGIESPEDARDRLLAAVNNLDRDLSARSIVPEAAGLRVQFTGRSDLRREVEALFAPEDLAALYVGNSRIHYFVESRRYDLAPTLDMETLAQRGDPPGLLARRLQLLERASDDPERRALIKDAREHLATRGDKPYWRVLGDTTPDDETVATWLREAGLTALDRLLAQQEAAE
mgnify:CR=1 FL=1